MISIKMKIGTKPLKDYAADVQAKLPKVVSKHALAIQGLSAKAAPVDTGALRNSMLAEKRAELRWEIHDGMEYGVYQELGTSKNVEAKHFLGGSCEKQADKFFEDVRKALK